MLRTATVQRRQRLEVDLRQARRRMPSDGLRLQVFVAGELEQVDLPDAPLKGRHLRELDGVLGDPALDLAPPVLELPVEADPAAVVAALVLPGAHGVQPRRQGSGICRRPCRRLHGLNATVP
jgi:hypothetical protein